MAAWLSPQVFAILSALVEERLGLHYGAADALLFSDKVASRATEAGFQSALDYYYYLRYDAGAPAELEALADALVVGETYFFRELDALQAGVTHFVAPAVARSGRARIWSAGCATGEEPLSLAMLLEDAGIRERCDIVATDVSARALKRAREGLYGARSMRLLPPHPLPANISPRLASIAAARLTGSPRVAADRRLVASIDYRQLNLLDEGAIASLGAFDLVLCRNVLIYFADDTIKRVVASLAGALATPLGGRLLVGASESLLRFGTVLRCEERGGSFFYDKEFQ